MPRVQATEKFETIIDGAIGRPRRKGEEWEVDKARADHLVAHGVAIIVFDETQEVIIDNKENAVELEKPKKSGRRKKN